MPWGMRSERAGSVGSVDPHLGLLQYTLMSRPTHSHSWKPKTLTTLSPCPGGYSGHHVSPHILHFSLHQTAIAILSARLGDRERSLIHRPCGVSEPRSPIANPRTACAQVDADLTAVLLRLRTGASSDPRADPALVRQELEGLGAALEEARQEGEKLGGWSKTLAQEGLAPPVQVGGKKHSEPTDVRTEFSGRGSEQDTVVCFGSWVTCKYAGDWTGADVSDAGPLLVLTRYPGPTARRVILNRMRGTADGCRSARCFRVDLWAWVMQCGCC